MNKMPLKHNLLVINILRGGIAFLKAKIVNTTLLLILTLFLLPSCEHVTAAELRPAADSANNDSTLWRSLQGF